MQILSLKHWLDCWQFSGCMRRARPSIAGQHHETSMTDAEIACETGQPCCQGARLNDLRTTVSHSFYIELPVVMNKLWC